MASACVVVAMIALSLRVMADGLAPCNHFDDGCSQCLTRLRCEGCCVSRRLNNVLPRDDKGGDNPGDDIAQPSHVRAGIRIEIGYSRNRVDHPIGQEDKSYCVAWIGGHGSLPWFYLLEQFILD